MIPLNKSAKQSLKMSFNKSVLSFKKTNAFLWVPQRIVNLELRAISSKTILNYQCCMNKKI
jgi:hypothetical protein